MQNKCIFYSDAFSVNLCIFKETHTLTFELIINRHLKQNVHLGCGQRKPIKERGEVSYRRGQSPSRLWKTRRTPPYRICSFPTPAAWALRLVHKPSVSKRKRKPIVGKRSQQLLWFDLGRSDSRAAHMWSPRQKLAPVEPQGSGSICLMSPSLPGPQLSFTSLTMTTWGNRGKKHPELSWNALHSFLGAVLRGFSAGDWHHLSHIRGFCEQWLL